MRTEEEIILPKVIFANKFIIHNCPASYEYYPLEKSMQICCYVAKKVYDKHTRCADFNGCILKEVIKEYTYKKGTIQEKLKVEWLDEIEDEL